MPTSATPSPAAQPPARRRTGRFGEQEWEVYDAWTPVTSRGDVTVVLVHGGLWQAAYDRAHLRPLGAALARNGWPVAPVEYTRIGMPCGGRPGTAEIVLATSVARPADLERSPILSTTTRL